MAAVPDATPGLRDPMLPARYRVASKLQETEDTWTFELEPLDGEAPIEFAPGQFNMIYSFGAGESAISISGNPAQPGSLTHTVRAVGVVTERICSSAAGDVLGIRGPYGSTWPVENAAGRDMLVVAGGIGLAPLRPILYEVLGARERFGRTVLLYGGRSPDQLLYEEELEAWRGGEGIDVHVTVDTASPGWRGRVGVVPALIERLDLDPARTVAYVCGPEIMMELSARALVDRGMDPGNIFLSMERNMKCAVGHCGHCQYGPTFVCRDGPVYSWAALAPLLRIREL
jgi:NAD(P)H-flavin reductase